MEYKYEREDIIKKLQKEIDMFEAEDDDHENYTNGMKNALNIIKAKK